MRNDLTELVYILDASGSMSSLADDTIGGFNSMINKQKEEPGEARITTIVFDSTHKTIHDHVNVKNIEPLTRNEYCPNGMTALLDALGYTINSIGERLHNTPEEERPGSVIFTITTDGYENSSREFTKDTIKKMIEHQQEKYNWKFLFIGANMDAVTEASTYGIDSSYAMNFSATDEGICSVYAAAADVASYAREATAKCCVDELDAAITALTSSIV